ncbi:MAG: hypothetical protein B1H07_00660 [Campylobacteraceae bacterium 4484_166]|nr:MAG: hypothetical protein B1H07_00660 [Campylobacteraceae bacterium 4484_166]
MIEEEIFLSNNICTKFEKHGFICHESRDLDVDDFVFDAIVLSITPAKLDYITFVKKYSQTTIILLSPKINDEDAILLLSYGADRYMPKPILIDELYQVVLHYIEYANMRYKLKIINNHFDNFFKTEFGLQKKYDLPLQINSSSSLESFAFAFNVAKQQNKTLLPIRFNFDKIIYKIKSCDFTKVVPYVYDTSRLDSSEINRYMNEFCKYKLIVCLPYQFNQYAKFELLKIKNTKNSFLPDDILTIDEYFKYIVQSFQNSMTDIKIASALGVSRKTLWDKRKKLNISNKK